MIYNVRVTPHARKESVELLEGTLNVKVTCPPEKGKANKEAIRLIAKHFKVSKGKIRILRGLTSRNKVIEIDMT